MNHSGPSSMQVGAIAENLVANGLMLESGGRLSPFKPVADDDGIDLLVYDKITGGAIPVQVKARTVTLKKRGSERRGNLVHFQVRQQTFKGDRYAHLLAVLLSDEWTRVEVAWLVPMEDVKRVGNSISGRYVIRASKGATSRDKWTDYRCGSMQEVAGRLMAWLEDDAADEAG